MQCSREKILRLAVGMAAGCFAASPALAGFIANSGSDVITMTDSTPSTGDTLTINDGNLSTYTPDTPADPQITTDLARYQYTFSATAGVPNPDGSVPYTGTYELFYDLDHSNSLSAGDPDVSDGVLNLTVKQEVVLGTSTLDVTFGSLNQTGPTQPNPPFADLSYGGVPVGFGGTIDIPTSLSSTTGTANLVFQQIAQAPEPCSIGLLGAGMLMLGRRRK
jgi:hypothetical protein